MQKAKDLQTLPLDYLLMIGEDSSNQKKRIFFKAKKENEEELNDKEVVLLTRKFERFLNKNENGRRGKQAIKRPLI